MRAIVTGGAGFIGSHVADALLARGNEVHVLDDLSTGRQDNVPAGATVHQGDIRHPGGGAAPPLPIPPSGTWKLAGGESLAGGNRLHGTRHVSLRYGNVYGPRQDPHGEAGVVAIFLGSVAAGERPTIF